MYMIVLYCPLLAWLFISKVKPERLRSALSTNEAVVSCNFLHAYQKRKKSLTLIFGAKSETI